MSPKTRLTPEQRRTVITDNILWQSYEELATICRCSKRTIIRDVQQWRADGGFEEMLFNEFLDLYTKVKSQNQEKALDKLVYLMAKGMTQKQEIKTELSGQLDITKKLDEIIEISREDGE